MYKEKKKIKSAVKIFFGYMVRLKQKDWQSQSLTKPLNCMKGKSNTEMASK